MKTTHALIIPSICKDDLLLMHPRFCKQLGNCSPLLLCLKVTSQLYFLDPTTNRKLVITPTQFFALEPYSDIYNFQHFGRNFIVLDNEGVRNQQSNNTVATWGLVVTLSQQMTEEFVRSHMNCQVGHQMQGYTLEEWGYIKNMPKYLIVKRIKSEQQMAKKKHNKHQKRKQKRQQAKRQQQEKQSKQDKENKEEQKPVVESKQQQNLEEKQEVEEDWIDIDEDEDDNDL